jgi:hypothetical protein
MDEAARTGEPGSGREEVLGALERYRGQRREGTGAIECLLERARGIAEDLEGHRRRVEMVEWATHERGMPQPLAEQVFDTAGEEGLDPLFAFEIVLCGVGVRELEPPGEGSDAPASVSGGPNWLETPPPEERARRERLLRSSFRRLRGLLERHASAEDALIAFTREPDVDETAY